MGSKTKKIKKKKQRKIPHEVYNVLMKGEEIMFAYKKRIYFEAKPPWVFVTNKRIFILDLGIGGYSFIDYPYEEITYLEFDHGLFFGSFAVESEKGDKTEIHWLDNPEPFSKLKNFCVEKIREVSTENPTIKEKSFFPWKSFSIKRSKESASRVKMELVKDLTEDETTSYAYASDDKVQTLDLPKLDADKAWKIITQETASPSEMLQIAGKMLKDGVITIEVYREITNRIVEGTASNAEEDKKADEKSKGTDESKDE